MPMTKTLARNDREWKALLRSKDPNVVRTMEDWKTLLKADESPFKGIDPKLALEFTKSLTFKNGGLAHADYSMIADVMPYSKFMKIWAHFGMGGELFADHDGYYCESQGSCYVRTSSICTSNC
jgi:hypothetical protein